MPSDRSQGPGNVSIDRVAIISSDGTAFELSTAGLLAFSIHEDILDSGIVGIISLQDTHNIPQLIDLKGGEQIEIKFKARGGFNYINFIGTITKIGEGIWSPPSSKIYTIEFASDEIISSMVQNIKKCYKGKYSDIAEKIFDEYLGHRGKRIHVQETMGADHILNITGWTPITAIRNITSKCIPDNPKYKLPAYLFFERCDDEREGGGFVFVSLEKLWSHPPVKFYNSQIKNLRDSEVDDYFSINWIIEGSKPDLITNIKKGLFNTNLLMNDLVKRMTTVESIDLGGHLMNDEDLIAGGLRSFPEAEPVEILASSEQHHSDGKEIYVIPHPQVIKLIRKNTLARFLFTQVIRIGVPGDSERSIGEVVNLSISSPESTADGGPPLDKFLSGNYIITALAHVVNAVTEDYETVMELCKNSNISV